MSPTHSGTAAERFHCQGGQVTPSAFPQQSHPAPAMRQLWAMSPLLLEQALTRKTLTPPYFSMVNIQFADFHYRM